MTDRERRKAWQKITWARREEGVQGRKGQREREKSKWYAGSATWAEMGVGWSFCGRWGEGASFVGGKKRWLTTGYCLRLTDSFVYAFIDRKPCYTPDECESVTLIPLLSWNCGQWIPKMKCISADITIIITHTLSKRSQQTLIWHFANKYRSTVNSVEIYEALVTKKSISMQTAFCWSTRQICVTNLNMSEICVGKSLALTQNSRSRGFLLEWLAAEWCDTSFKVTVKRL